MINKRRETRSIPKPFSRGWANLGIPGVWIKNLRSGTGRAFESRQEVSGLLLADWSLVTIRVEALTRKNPPGAQRHPRFIESRLGVDPSNHAQSSGLGQRINAIPEWNGSPIFDCDPYTLEDISFHETQCASHPLLQLNESSKLVRLKDTLCFLTADYLLDVTNTIFVLRP